MQRLVVGLFLLPLFACADPVVVSRPAPFEFTGTAVFADSSTTTIHLSCAEDGESYIGNHYHHRFQSPATTPVFLKSYGLGFYPPTITFANGSPPSNGSLILRGMKVPFSIVHVAWEEAGGLSPLTGNWWYMEKSTDSGRSVDIETLGATTLFMTYEVNTCVPQTAPHIQCALSMMTYAHWGL